MTAARRWLPAALLATLLAAGAGGWYLRADRSQTLAERMASRAGHAGWPRVECAPSGVQPLVLLALGQSNAGNHGSAAAADPPVTILTRNGCISAGSPLPGATGTGGSIWARLPPHLARLGERRPVVLVVLAVDASSIAEWTTAGSPLRAELESTLGWMRLAGRVPAAVMWQQGEADARLQTRPALYAEALGRLSAILRARGWQGPLLVALSTRCRSQPDEPLRAEVRAWIGRTPGAVAGPDTDALASDDERHDGCHFSGAGQDAAAGLWARALLPVLARAP